MGHKYSHMFGKHLFGKSIKHGIVHAVLGKKTGGEKLEMREKKSKLRG